MDWITLIWIMIAIMLFIIAFVVGFVIYQLRVYRFRVRLYRNIGSGWQEFKVYRARELKIPGSIGEKVLYVPKVKEYISSYGEMMGKNLYYYAVGQDGYWYNIKLGDIDAKMGVLDIEVVNRDVRAFHTTMAKNIRERYNAPKNWPAIVMAFSVIIALVIVFAGGYFLYDKVNEISVSSSGSLKAAEKVATSNLQSLEAQKEIASLWVAALSKANVTVKEGKTGIARGNG